MASLGFVTRKYIGKDWYLDTSNGFLKLKDPPYTDHADYIAFPHNIAANSLVVGVRSFYLVKNENSTSSQISFGFWSVPTVVENIVQLKPQIGSSNVSGKEMNVGASFLELSIIVSYS